MSGVAKFPWDPEPVPSPRAVVQSSYSLAGTSGLPTGVLDSSATSSAVDSQIVTEVKHESAISPMSGHRNGSNGSSSSAGLAAGQHPLMFSNPTMAAMRAAQQIQQFAQESKVPLEVADESIKGVMKRAGLDAGESSNGNTNDGGGGLMLPGGGRMAQVDGAVDEDNFEGADQMDRAEIDRTLHLNMLKRVKSKKRAELQLLNAAKAEGRVHTSTHEDDQEVRNKGSHNSIPQFDGASDSSEEEDDEDEDDEDIAPVSTGGASSSARRQMNGDDSDAINSDLDDSEDEINSQNDDDGDDSGMLMLCMYDKVTRTKNKWKCFLKDGVVGVNGKDYLFGKGNGEYEW